ncbi:MAG: outer membrane lipoprotein carrier protein LolA [Thermoanaerobaculia bacterium]|nr:outer membrane lipoprotein carrier protein LolA [Thermoanaerobaculia bacterium]
MRELLRLSSAVALLLALTGGASAQEAPDDPWGLVDRVRRALEDSSPLAAGFRQTYLPLGFSSGESESGRVALHLPRCLRWEYLDPFPRTYLLCGDLLWAWNEGETVGRRQQVGDEPGLDLLRLRAEALRGRYRAELAPAGEGRAEVRLAPLAPGALRDATLTIDLEALRVIGLAYHDAEGNLTRFELDGFAPLAADAELAPPQLEWLDQ